MNFRRGLKRDEPEINLIPMIDLLLVILIFLMVSTSYSKVRELQLNLPSARAERPGEPGREIVVAISREGRYLIGNAPVGFVTAERFAAELRRAAGPQREPTVVIHADAGASHQSVVNVLEAARLAGMGRIAFAAQSPAPAARQP